MPRYAYGLGWYSPETLAKAHELLKADAIERTGDLVYRVRGSKDYRVQVIENRDEAPWLTCNCPNGIRKGGEPSCYHSAAVLLHIYREEAKGARSLSGPERWSDA